MTEWQPIETAPKVGDFIIYFTTGYMSVGRLHNGKYLSADSFGASKLGLQPEPIAWMPLPAPPKSDSEACMTDSTADWSVMTQAQKDAALRSARAQGMREAAGYLDNASKGICECILCQTRRVDARRFRTRADAIERGE